MHTVHAAALSALPSHLAQAVWPGHALGAGSDQVVASGHAALDAELPGGGWPAQSLTEVLQVQSGQAEWRLLGPTLAQLVRQGGSVLLIGPPHVPFLPGLAQAGLPDHRLIWVDAQTPAERLWATEQALKAGCVSAVLSWLPQARPAQIRRLHACAAQHPGLLFVFRPQQAQDEASAAPLRLTLGVGPCPHPLLVHVFKRRGPAMATPLSLGHWPAGVPQVWPASIQAPPDVHQPRLDARLHQALFQVVLLVIDHGRHFVVFLGQQVELVRQIVLEKHFAHFPLHTLGSKLLAYPQAIPDLQRAFGIAHRA